MSTERTSLHGKISGKGKTHATGKATKDVVYSVSLKLNEIKSNIVNLQKFSKNNWQNVEKGEDLLQIKDKLRIIVEDNTGETYGLQNNKDKLWHSRGDFYSLNSGVLNSILNFSIPLKLEIRKFHNNEQLSVEKSKDIRAVIEVLDPEENVDHVKGVFTGDHVSGKEFIKLFNTEIRKQSSNDNCDESLAPEVLKDRCRAVGGSVRADKIFFYSNNDKNPPQHETSSSNVVVVNQWQEEVEKNDVKFITANIDFRPPPILGDNYILKISIEKKPIDSEYWKKVELKEKNEYETPEITIWRKVRLKLFVQGSSPNDKSVYDSIKWDNVKKAYSDAYIEVEHHNYYIIPTSNWINYLQNHVYKGWRSTQWGNYPLNLKEKDLEKYSFPIGKNGELSPPDNLSWKFLEILAEEIVKDVLGGNVNVKDGVSTKDCFYVLVCRPPSPNSKVRGKFVSGKLFYMITSGDVAVNLAHELGHALFLMEGATRFHEHYFKEYKFGVVVTEYAKGNKKHDPWHNALRTLTNPSWDLHDSEDMISCIMSYENDNCEYENNQPKKVVNPVNWHFCGVCLLLLRFYDENKLIKNNIFLGIQYTRSKNMIIYYIGGKSEKTNLPKTIIVKNGGTLTMKKGESGILYVLYPQEGVINNRGLNPYKDVSTYGKTRSRWIFTDPNTNQVLSPGMGVVKITHDLIDDTVRTLITAGERTGENKVSFEIINPTNNQPLQSISLTIKVVP